jgi:WD40 repeat protein
MKKVLSKETFFTASSTAFNFQISIDPSSKYIIRSCPNTKFFTIGHSKSTKIFVLNRIGKMLCDFKIPGKNNGVLDLQFHSSGLLAARGTHSVSIVEDFSDIVEISMEKGIPSIMAWSQDGNYLAIGGNDGSLIIYNLLDEKKLFLESKLLLIYRKTWKIGYKFILVFT